MFTGIIEEIGVVNAVVKTREGTRLTILAKTALEEIHIGESLSLNGACMTVVARATDQFTVDVSPETLKMTTLGMLKAGDPVNLERPMPMNGRLHGHLVTGHVDGIGTIRDRVQDVNAVQITIGAPAEILRYCVVKGSVAVDGISLTINTIGLQGFGVTVIPHTAKLTTLGLKQIGAQVNLESDLIGKYVERLFPGTNEGRPDIKIDKDYLERRGLI